MKKFTFNRGTWIDGNNFPEWNENEEHHEYLERIGYNFNKANFGSENEGNGIEIYGSSEEDSFYINVCPLDSCFEVFISDFPSLMMFLKEYAGVFTLSSINTTQLEIQSMLEKLFQVQHGHSAYSICQKCDPEGWARMKKYELKKQSKEG